MTLHTGRHFLQIPGPTNVPDRVLRAMDMPTLDHRGPEFAELGYAVLAGMQRIFRTKQPVIIYPVVGHRRLGSRDRQHAVAGRQGADGRDRPVRGAVARHRREVQARRRVPADRLAPRRRRRSRSRRGSPPIAQHKIKAVMRRAQRDLDELRHPSARSPQSARPRQTSGAVDGRHHLRPRLARIRARRLGYRCLGRRIAEGHDAAAGPELQRGLGKGAGRLEGQHLDCGPIGTGTT